MNSFAANTSKTKSPSCDQVLNACDKAVNALKLDVVAEQNLNKDLTNQVNLLNEQNVELKADADHFWHNPFVMISVGILVGGAVGVWAAKK